MWRRTAFALTVVAAAVVIAWYVWPAGPRDPKHSAAASAESSAEAGDRAGHRGNAGAKESSEKKRRPRDDERIVTPDERKQALARAQVWRQPAVPIARARLGRSAGAPELVTCRFRLNGVGGTTAKFDCDVEGEKVRIKYGAGPELPAEAAATRLLGALGFGADDVTLIPRLRCHGCPAEPFVIAKVADVTGTKPLVDRTIDYGDYHEFDWVALERKLDARPIETEDDEGWAFHELDTIDPASGGAPRAHVDALRLMAVFLAHWDNKSENQRLVCLGREWTDGTPCRAPFAMIQDLGGTFGPRKVDLKAWEAAPIFEDRARCVISMRDLPYDGATFASVQIGEAGRRHLGGLLSQLTDGQLADLFSDARFDQKRHLFTKVHPVSEWVRVFKAKVRAITGGPACPS
jgi:hypothetical protein